MLKIYVTLDLEAADTAINLTKCVFLGTNVHVGGKTDNNAKDKSDNRKVLKCVIKMIKIGSMAEGDMGAWQATHFMDLVKNENVEPLIKQGKFFSFVF